MKTISIKTLRKLKACSEQVEKFKALFGTGEIPVTLENCLKAAAGLNVDWAAWNLLSHQARKAYEEALAPAWKSYYEAEAVDWKAYNEARARAFFAAWKSQLES